jgi:hypothetical protein
VELDKPQDTPTSASAQLGKRSRDATTPASRKRSRTESALRDNGLEEFDEPEVENDEINQFRRVHVIHKQHRPFTGLRLLQEAMSMITSLSVMDSVVHEIGKFLELPERADGVIPGEDDEPYIIRCICPYDDDDGHTVLCERCETWQHVVCYYHKEDIPDSHNCVDCEPRALDANGARDRQKGLRGQVNPVTRTLLVCTYMSIPSYLI